jgi:Mg2+-importing ATPase
MRNVFLLPKHLLASFRRNNGQAVRVSPAVLDAARLAPAEVFHALGTTPQGLTAEQAEQRLREHGPNTVAQEPRLGRVRLLIHALVNPLVILLAILAIVSVLTGDLRAAGVMLLMLLLGVALRFVQEARADDAAARLKAMISVTATVVRDGRTQETPISQIVPGDVVQLAAGDMIPADVRLVTAKDLFVVQSALTGESFPVEKYAEPDPQAPRLPTELRNICYLGTSVENGSATAVVVTTGLQTYLGSMASSITAEPPPTAFDKGISRFTWLMIRFMLVMVPLVFVINGIAKGKWAEAFFFAVAIAVGLTPEMLPMIVSVCLSRGAVAMSRRKVIVKRLSAIQNLGAMDVLCTDKTGTLTMDRVILERHCNVALEDDDDVLALAFLNSHFQTGLKNVLDRAILRHQELHQELKIPAWSKVDEIPFDFSRRLMSVVVDTPEKKHRLICKGAPEAVFPRCDRFELSGEIYPMDPLLLRELEDEYKALSADGFRVLALAYRDLPEKPAYSKKDEQNLVLRGYVAFLDPPKDTARPAIEALQKHGVAVKVLTGDNELVSRKICHEVGLPPEQVLLGSDVETMSDDELGAAAEGATLMARLSPTHKQRVIRALRTRGHVVGFLGDGINDAPALRAADVGLSVDSAVDIAQESADIILLEKSLVVLEEGVLQGRKVFANILKYVRMGASSNFGNMLSVLGASLFLPFLPMAPIQILANNLLYDISQIPIPTDEVDPEQIATPQRWSIKDITRFILFIGPCSSVFDYTTYFMMLYLFGAWDKPALFQTGWFVESLLTQTLIIHIIRTNRIPFFQSRASWPLLVLSAIVMIVGIWLPFSFVAPALGFTSLPARYWPLLLVTLVCYTLLTQTVKTLLLRRGWI